MHLPHAAHRIVGRRGTVRLVNRGGADRAGVQTFSRAFRREETRGDGVEADAVPCPLDGQRPCHDVDAGLRHRGRYCEGAIPPSWATYGISDACRAVASRTTTPRARIRPPTTKAPIRAQRTRRGV